MSSGSSKIKPACGPSTATPTFTKHEAYPGTPEEVIKMLGHGIDAITDRCCCNSSHRSTSNSRKPGYELSPSLSNLVKPNQTTPPGQLVQFAMMNSTLPPAVHDIWYTYKQTQALVQAHAPHGADDLLCGIANWFILGASLMLWLKLHMLVWRSAVWADRRLRGDECVLQKVEEDAIECYSRTIAGIHILSVTVPALLCVTSFWERYWHGAKVLGYIVVVEIFWLAVVVATKQTLFFKEDSNKPRGKSSREHDEKSTDEKEKSA